MVVAVVADGRSWDTVYYGLVAHALFWSCSWHSVAAARGLYGHY